MNVFEEYEVDAKKEFMATFLFTLFGFAFQDIGNGMVTTILAGFIAIMGIVSLIQFLKDHDDIRLMITFVAGAAATVMLAYCGITI
ncbi:MAG: hypothetical protein E7Z65_01530 [Thermoplasmata archaeon]|nr:hypothetical protein [Thermoplasmata archaeon]